jgi:hypothetical protein
VWVASTGVCAAASKNRIEIGIIIIIYVLCTERLYYTIIYIYIYIYIYTLYYNKREICASSISNKMAYLILTDLVSLMESGARKLYLFTLIYIYYIALCLGIMGQKVRAGIVE